MSEAADRRMKCGHTPEECDCDPTPEQEEQAARDETYWDGDYEPECCPHCGKEYEDFSDMGCGYCDQRSPDWGMMP